MQKRNIRPNVTVTCYNSKTSTAANVVNLVPSHVYHSERPPLLAARLPRCSAPCGFVSDSWYFSCTPCLEWKMSKYSIHSLSFSTNVIKKQMWKHFVDSAISSG